MALDLSAPGASARTEAYQSGGVEVLAIARLPLSARSSDAPARAEAKLTALPAAAAVLDLGEEGLEPGRAAFDPVLGQLAEASRVRCSPPRPRAP